MAELTGLDYTNAIKIEFEKLQAENAQLKSQLAEAMELLKEVKNKVDEVCLFCSNNGDKGFLDCDSVECNFKWQHQDRYEKLKSEVGQNGSYKRN